MIFSIELVSVLLVSSNYEMLKDGCIAASSELEPCERAFWIEKRKLSRQSRVLDLSPTNFPQRLKINRPANTWVILVRYMFEPSELNGRNVRGVSNKKPLDPEKYTRFESLSTSIFWHTSSERELIRRDFRTAIDTYLRSREPKTLKREMNSRKQLNYLNENWEIF